MRVVVTGSAGHLGEALALVLGDAGHEVVGVDLLPSPHTTVVGSVEDEDLVRRALEGADAVVHAATLHKPHVGTHPRAAFVGTNVLGTLRLLEGAVAAGVGRFVLASTTSAFGRSLRPPAGHAAAWVDETLQALPRNVYGATKVAAEDLAELVHRDHGLPVVVLRLARFFPEPDDDPARRAALTDDNLKAVELLHRRVDLEDAASACVRAIERAPALGFGRYVVSAATPFTRADVADLRGHAPAVLRRRAPEAAALLASCGWTMPDDLDRVYDSARARADLGWRPRWDFAAAVRAATAGRPPRSALAGRVGAKGYHAETTGVYTRRA